MRKDVKIIMAICVIVLVGLIVYALFLPGEKKSPVATTENTENTSADNTGTTPVETAEQSPATQPSETSVSSAESTTQPSGSMASSPTTMPSQMAMAGNSAVMPTPTAAAPASGDWNKLLETGSSTPDASSSMSGTAASPSSAGMSAGAAAMGAGTAGATAMSSTPMPMSAAGSSSDSSLTGTSAGSTGSRTYVIKSGDTPSSIAQAQYGNRALYAKILAANPKLNARHMRVGQKIILPALSAASSTPEKTTGTSAAVEDTSTTSTEKTSSSSLKSPSIAEPGSRYTVVSGDSLQRIAAKVYGNSANWQKIYDLNKSKIGSNPAHLRVGMVLMLPKGKTTGAAASSSASQMPEATPAQSADTTATPINTQPVETMPASVNSASR